MPAISATNLSIGYKGSPIVSDINLQLHTGRIICLLGPNGAGKTTLMKTLLGRIRPVSGSVTYTQTGIEEMSAAIDHPSFFPYLSGRQNVRVASAFWGLDVDPESALDSVGIGRAAHGRKAKDYSTGMKERLELCLAMLSRPRFLFLDEPQNGLDADGMISLTETLRAYRDAGNCVVISTHLLHEIQGVPDECIVIRHGRAEQITDLTGVNIADLYGRALSAAAPVRALVTYYWSAWYFLAAVFGSVSSLLMGSWISSEANGTPITGGYSFLFTGTQPLICLALLYACDARVAKAHYGGLPYQVYFAWKPCSLRTVFRALVLIAVNLLSVLGFDAIMILTGAAMHPHLTVVLCFVVLQSLLIALVYSIIEIAVNPTAAGVVSGVLCYVWILLPGDLPDYATPYVANALRAVGLNLNGTMAPPGTTGSRSPGDPVMLAPIVALSVVYVLLGRFRCKGVERK